MRDSEFFEQTFQMTRDRKVLTRNHCWQKLGRSVRFLRVFRQNHHPGTYVRDRR